MYLCVDGCRRYDVFDGISVSTRHEVDVEHELEDYS